MLIRIFIKYHTLIILFLMPMSVYAKEINFISTDSSKSPVEKIDQFFLQNSQKKKCDMGTKN